MSKKFAYDVHLERSEQQDYPLLDVNEILLKLAELNHSTTKRFDKRVQYPLNFKLRDEERGYVGLATAGMVDTEDISIALLNSIRALSDDEIKDLMKKLRAALKERRPHKKKAVKA
jgi:hypothetical protein